MKFKAEQTYEKLRGGYYTPTAVADFLTHWALADGACSVLEPSCGDGAFLRSVVSRSPVPKVVHGVELDPTEATKARTLLGPPSDDRRIFAMDFLTFAETPGRDQYDAAVGNPPYIRYQFLSQQTQALARELYARHGLPFTKHLNAWAPFVVDSLDRLAPGGRLAMVVPAELMNVLHAGGLRLFLLTECSQVLLIDPQTLIFDQALQGTVLLMAVKRRAGETAECQLAITRETDTTFLACDPGEVVARAQFVCRAPSAAKWMDALLTAEEQAMLDRVADLPAVRLFGDIATVGVGIVTGANQFFLVPDAVVDDFGLHEFARPMFGRSFHCRGVVYSRATHDENRAKGNATNFLHFGATPFDALPAGAHAYIQKGEADGLHLRYKCRIRQPWYDVPSVHASPLSLLKRSHEIPRVIVNELGALTTDTAYRIATHLPAPALAVGFVNSLTALSAEMAGRAYGGGVLELVPSEIRKLLVPVVDATDEDLRTLDDRFRRGEDVESILEHQDALVLGQIGLHPQEIALIQQARRRLMNRRLREADVA